MSLYEAARTNMVEGQVKPNRVTDIPLLTAMLNIERERFVPEAMQGIAYCDEAIAIGRGRYLVEPMVTGRLLQEAKLREGDRVLIVGALAGYTAAICARLGVQLVALEQDRYFAQMARENLSARGIATVMIVEGPLAQGWPASAPYDVIIVDGGVASVPRAILDQLAEGGRLVTMVVGRASPGGVGVGRGTVFARVGGTIVQRPVFDASTPLLPGFEPKAGFEF